MVVFSISGVDFEDKLRNLADDHTLLRSLVQNQERSVSCQECDVGRLVWLTYRVHLDSAE